MFGSINSFKNSILYGLTNLANDIIYKFEYVIFKEVLLLKTESERLIGRFALWNKHVCFASCFVGGFFRYMYQN